MVRREEIEQTECERIKNEICAFFNVDPVNEVDDKEYVQRYPLAYRLGESIFLRMCGPEFGNGFKSCYIELKGEGCREFEARCPEKTWEQLLRHFVQDRDGTVKRVDIAIDDFEGKYVTFDWILDKLNKDLFSSMFTNRNFNIHGNINTGRSITFGSHSSSLMLCIYEKLKQQQTLKKECAQNYWVRYEMRFAQKRGEDFAYNFLKQNKHEFKEYILSLFYQMLDIKEDSDSDKAHISRVPTDPKWRLFLNRCEKIKMEPAYQINPCYITYEDWLFPLIGDGAVYLMMIYKHEYYSAITKIYEEAYKACERFNKKKVRRINSYLKNKALPLVSLEDVQKLGNEIKEIIEERKLPF